MKAAVFDSQSYERDFFTRANAKANHELVFFDARLVAETARLAQGFPAVVVMVSDRVDAPTLELLKEGGTALVTTRSTGFNHIDLKAAARLGIKVTRVTDYSPYSVAEHAVGLLLALDRKICRAYNRTRDGNFSLDGLMGFDLHGKSVGVIGTGKIGCVFARIMSGFGCRVLGYDVARNPEFEALGGHYAEPEEIGKAADVISLHCPLTPQTHHIINTRTLAHVKPGVLLINTSRGGLLDTEAAIEALKSGRLGGLAIDVYEQEADIFFQDLSSRVITDDVIQRLVSFPNVIVTGHQAYFTHEAITTIIETTLENISAFAEGRKLENEVLPPPA